MVSIRSALIMLLTLAPMLVSGNAAASIRSRQYDLVPVLSSLQLTSTPTTTTARSASTAFVNRRYYSFLLPRGGGSGDGQEIDGDGASQSQDKDGKNNLEGGEGQDAWEEVIRNTREYYSSASQSSKSSSSTFGSTLIASHASPTTAMTTTTTTTTTTMDTKTDPNCTATAATITSNDNGEDGRVFGNSHTSCDSNFEQDNGQGRNENGDGGNYLTSTTITEKVKESDVTNYEEEEEDVSTIHDDNGDDDANSIDNMKEEKRTQVRQIDLEDFFVQHSGDGTNLSKEIEITIQETAAYNGVASNQVENTKSTEERNDGDDDSEGIMNYSDVYLPVINLEVGHAAVNHEVQAVEIGKQANKNFAAEDSHVEEGRIRRFDPHTRLTEISNEVLAGDKEQDELAQNDNDDKTKVDSFGSNQDNVDEGKEVKGIIANDKSKGVALREFCNKIQSRISTLMMICRRKEVRPIIILTSMGAVTTLLLNSTRVSEKSMNTAQTFESQSNEENSVVTLDRT